MLNVIIADDELLMRIGLKSMINWEEHGFQIVGEATNGQEALDIASAQRVDLVITDIMMPIMDGIALIREMSDKQAGCQFVILSCMDEFQYAKEAIRLGAVDYLIKSDLKQQQLMDVLEIVKSNAAKRSSGMPKEQYKESLAYLKEVLFKELFSGFRSEEEMLARMSTLQIGVKKGKLVLIKLRVDSFEEIRQKYIEQDEKLLRYAIVNVMEEVIPSKWSKEIVIESSAAYLLIANVSHDTEELPKEVLNALFDKILTAMKDFLNIQLSIGVSTLVNGFAELRKAYQEADAVMDQHFFQTGRRVLYADSVIEGAARRESYTLNGEEENTYRQLVENHPDEAIAYLQALKQRICELGVSEQGIRKAYIRLLSLTASCFPVIPDLLLDGRTPYERVMHEEKLDHLHEVVVLFLEHCQQHNVDQLSRPQGYGEQAKLILLERYADDLSLQLVASMINVNPSYLSRVFRQEMGETFINYLTKVRIDKAKQLLRGKNVRIYEVAHATGYTNTAYFCKIFKKTTGHTPEEYRGVLLSRAERDSG